MDSQVDLQPENCTVPEIIGELPPGTITTRGQECKIRAFATHVCVEWWLTCKKTVDSQWNDLQLYKHLLEYEAVDKVIAQSAILALKRYLWYLTPEMVPLALFSDRVPAVERQALADALLMLRPLTSLQAPMNRFGNGWRKPRFVLSIDSSTRLCQLVGVDVPSSVGQQLLKSSSRRVGQDICLHCQCWEY